MSTSVIKPWGKEVILTDKDLPYAGKILYVLANSRLSLQYHDQKTETLTLVSGQAQLFQGAKADHLETINMALNQGYTLNPGVIHRLHAITNSVIFEVSTPETGSTVRLEDDYQRPNETDSIRDLPDRGWSQNVQ